MKIGRVFPDLLTPFGGDTTLEERLTRAVRRLVGSTGTVAGGLLFRPPRGEPIVVTSGPARSVSPALRAWLGAALQRSTRTAGLATVTPPGVTGRGDARLLRLPLGAPGEPAGTLMLLGRGRRFTRRLLPAGFPREFGAAITEVWRLHHRTLRMAVLNDLTTLLVSADELDAVFRGFAEGLSRLVAFDSMAVALIDEERGEAALIDVLARATRGVPPRDARLPLAGTLLEELVARAAPLRLDDVSAAGVSERAQASFGARGFRCVMLVPLIAGGGVIGAVIVASARAGAFGDADTDVVSELARPLASAIEQRRLLEETRRRAEELQALLTTSRLITTRLDAASVLERISRSVASLIGSTGCGIGLLDAERGVIHQAAAHGFRTEEWRALEIPLGEGIIGLVAATGAPIRVDDVQTDPRSAQRNIDEREGIRSMLCVPLRSEHDIIGVIAAFSTRPAAFTAHHQSVLEAFAEQAGIALANARLFEESERRARETRALLEAGRVVSATLDVDETMRVILDQAKNVLGVASCGIMTKDPATGDLVNVASLDLPPELAGQIRIKEGEGITGRAVAERRPVQSRDLFADDRSRFRDLRRQTGFRSMLAVPLREGERAIGALVVFRHDIHDFTLAEEELLVALADQAAIALEHARLYEGLEAMVADRTRELDAQKRFVEVVLETLPLGVFVLDDDLAVIRVNREGERVLPSDAQIGAPFVRFLGDGTTADLDAWLAEAREDRRVSRLERELTVAAETRVLRLTAAPLGSDGASRHLVVLVEDVTLAKRLEQQLLLTERLTTAGKLASGVAHELNNPLATIAGCAESLLGRLREGDLATREELADFPRYLGLIEEEAYRCKEITGSLLQFVREPGSRRAPTDVNALIQKVIELLSHQSRFARSRFATELDPEVPPVTVNEGQLRQVCLGLAANALEAMDGHGTLTIRTRVHREEVEVEFEDEGPGIPDETLPRIFDPFFTTKPPGQGTGLGLAIAQGIVADHGGRIEVTSRLGKGTVFRVVVPR